MLDAKFIRENPEKVKEELQNRGEKVDIERLLELDEARRKLIAKSDELRAEQKQAGKKIRNSGEAVIKKMKGIKEKIKQLEKRREEAEKEYYKLMLEIPNMPEDNVPVGRDENDNKVIKTVGKKPEFDFSPEDHAVIGERLDIIDIKRAVKISGSRFVYLKNEAAILQMALINYSWNILLKKGFIPLIPPVLSKIDTVLRTGHPEALSDDAYRTTEDDLVLVGSSEQSIVSMHLEEILNEDKLPLRYTGYSTCFRREAGSYGKDTKGILRLHQFDKVEMVSFVKPEDSTKEFDFLLSVEEELLAGLELPYRVVSICTGDMGFTASKQYDLEVWLPGQNTYRETHSISNCTDFQARRLNTKYKNKKGQKKLLHTLNATGFAVGRTLIAILENNQQKDGSIKIPAALQNYCGFKKIFPKK